jgi:hypothetical protein
VQTIDGFGRYADRCIEAEALIGTAKIVVNCLGNTDALYASLTEGK